MRNARGFVDDYRRKGYPDDRIRIIASMRPEPLRSEALQILDAEVQAQKEADAPPAGHEDVGLTTSEQPAVQADEVTAVFEPSTPPSAAVEAAPAAAKPAAATPHPDIEALRQEAAAVRGERDKIAADLRKTSAELTRARAEVTRLNSDNAELPALRRRVAELEAALAAKESLLTEKEEALSEKETALAEERAEREAAGGRVEELAATVEGQSARMRELEALHQQLAGADAELDGLRAAAAQLKQGVEAKCEHIAELQADVSKTRDEAAALRQQVESNEKAVGQLQDKLTSREAELTSLRAHFDREAADLKKRADQEMWILRRRLRRFQKGALAGGLVAACFLVVLAFYAIGGPRSDSFVPKQLAATTNRLPQSGTATNPVQTPPPPLRVPGSVANPPAPAKQPETPRTVSWNLLKVDEPPRGSVAPLPAAKGPVTTPPEVLAIPTKPAPRPAAAAKVVTYTVKSGDTLWDISQKVLGRAELWRSIARENKISEIHPDVREGMTLTITVPSSN
jgi:nucleoid-associated protein YgaU